MEISAQSVSRADLLFDQDRDNGNFESDRRISDASISVEREYLNILRDQFGDLEQTLPSAQEDNKSNPSAASRDVAQNTSEAAHRPVETYEFQLFAPRATTADSKGISQTILIKSPTPEHTDPAYISRERPRSYYFADDLDGAARARFQESAISGDQIIANKRIRWKGSEIPWRVTVLYNPASCLGRQDDATAHMTPTTGHTVSSRRCRAGKKRRIMIRKKLQATAEKVRAAALAKEQAFEAEREKRNRRNREKKVKRRQKKRDAKLDPSEDKIID